MCLTNKKAVDEFFSKLESQKIEIKEVKQVKFGLYLPKLASLLSSLLLYKLEKDK